MAHKEIKAIRETWGPRDRRATRVFKAQPESRATKDQLGRRD